MRIYYKTKILINGLFPLENFKIDGFTEKTGIYDNSIIDKEDDENIFYSSIFLIKALYNSNKSEAASYEYFENDE